MVRNRVKQDWHTMDGQGVVHARDEKVRVRPRVRAASRIPNCTLVAQCHFATHCWHRPLLPHMHVSTPIASRACERRQPRSWRCPSWTARLRRCTAAARSASMRTFGRCGRAMCPTLVWRMRWRSECAPPVIGMAGRGARRPAHRALRTPRACAQMGPWLAVEIPSLVANGRVKHADDKGAEPLESS